MECYLSSDCCLLNEKDSGDWKVLINLNESKRVISLPGLSLMRPPTEGEHLLGGYHSETIVAVNYFNSNRDEDGPIELCNLMNGWREVVLTREQYNKHYRLSYFFMVNDIVHFAMIKTRKKDGTVIN
jgi:hypothetical protein